jgi:hypothetical protein
MTDDIEALPVVRLARVPTDERAPPWLVQGIWGAEAVGCIGGMPKIGKTWLGLELAVAIASGRPFLDRFPVEQPGPVMLFCAEDHVRCIKQRVAGLARVKGLDFDKLAIGWIGVSDLWLDEPRHRRALARTIAEKQPRMLVLDPLVRLHRGDENSAADVSDVLGWLRSLQRTHHVAVALVHHVRKSGASEPGTALRGSGDLHAWGDSNLYLVRRDGKVALVAEHRAHRAPEPLHVALTGEPPRLTATTIEPEQPEDPLDDRIVAALRSEPLTRTVLRGRLCVRNETLGAAIDRLVASGRVLRVDDGLAVPVPPSADRRERNAP